MTFTKAKTGRLLQVGEGYAFCPDHLPPSGWSLPVDLWPRLVEVRTTLANLEGRLVHLDRPDFLPRVFSRREASWSATLAQATGDLSLPVPAPAPLPPMLAAEAAAALDAYRAVPTGIDPVAQSFLVHYQAAAIHGFTAAALREARQLSSVDWLTMSEFYAARPTEYAGRLIGVATNGEWDAWLAFALEGAVSQAREAVRLCGELVAQRSEVRARLTGRPQRLRDLADRLFEEPTISVREARDLSAVTYPTARADLKALEALGIVNLLPDADEISYRLINPDYRLQITDYK
jgi:hypothetical protein